MASSSGDAAAEIEVTPSPPNGKRRRRCVQSKLPWSLPRVSENAESAAEPAVVAVTEAENIEEDEGSDGGSNVKKRRKKVSKPRVSKKSPSPNKPVRMLTRGKKASVASPGRNGTPKKVHDLHGGEVNSLSPEPSPISDKNDTLKDTGSQNQICNLRLEAKFSAEENQRLSSGKQIHPFFTSRKSAKRVIESQDNGITGSQHCFDLDQDGYVPCSPFHVAYSQDDVTPLNWSKWEFMENTFSESCFSFRNILPGIAEPLKLLSFGSEGRSGELTDTPSCSAHLTTITSASAAVQGQKEQLLPDSEFGLSDQFPLSTACSFGGNIETTRQDKHSDQLIHSHLPLRSLWTDKYQPENASAVCGNYASVKLLNEWLRTWQENSKNSTVRRKLGKKKHANEDSDDSLYDDEADVDESSDSSNHKNVLLITGPIGSGKSAAVYACAKEQGFEVIEVNTSDTRNGAYLKLKFGDSMESHGLNHWTAGQMKDEARDHYNGLVTKELNLIGRNVSDDPSGNIKDKSLAGCSWNFLEERSSTNQAVTKTLILFEDVDTVFEEDTGFISSILHLAENTKRPIILTSNREDPKLPMLLERLVVDFKYPSLDELLRHVQMICASEESQISDNLLKQLIRSSFCDIRKTLTLLQFWCQGENQHKAGCLEYRCTPIEFDIDTVHLALPRVFPWEFHCALSEKVAEEVNSTITSMEESLNILDLNQLELFDALTDENTAKTKKRKKLKKNISDLNCSEPSSQVNDFDDFFNARESPVITDRRRTKQRPKLILSSQSDDGSGDDIPSKDFTSFLPPHVSPAISTVPCSLLETESLLESPTVRNHLSWTSNIQQTASVSHICDTMQLQEESLVPESFLISETEISKRDSLLSVPEAFNCMAACSAGFVRSISVSKEANSSSEFTIDLNICPDNNDEDNVESVSGEELGDSQVATEPQFNEYNLLDECSRANFSSWLVPEEDDKCSREIVQVQEAWQKLRHQREKMKACLGSNWKGTSLMLKITSKVSELISETDVMLNKCYPFLTDILEASLTPVAEPDAFSWYNDQFRIGSTYAQHGLSISLNECHRVCSEWGFQRTKSLADEMLACSTKSMAFGKLLNMISDSTENAYKEGVDEKELRHGIPVRRKPETSVLEALHSIVPPRLSMTLSGPALHDYLAFASKISKFEGKRLSDSTSEISGRRSRKSRHYLASGPHSLSSEDAELLAQYYCYAESIP